MESIAQDQNQHITLMATNFNEFNDECPVPSVLTDTKMWNGQVNMPYAQSKRWQLICEALNDKIETCDALECMIGSYNGSYKNSSKFHALHETIGQFDDTSRTYFFNDVLPVMMRIVSDLEYIFPSGIPLLASGQQRSVSVSMSQFQILVILSSAFLCIFDDQPPGYPLINFDSLFRTNKPGCIEKLKCILAYFRMATAKCNLF